MIDDRSVAWTSVTVPDRRLGANGVPGARRPPTRSSSSGRTSSTSAGSTSPIRRPRGASGSRRSGRSQSRLDALDLDALHFTGPGTDLTVGLLPSSRFAKEGGASHTRLGVRHIPNIPTEEVYTTPDPERVDGFVAATKPLDVSGSLVTGLRIRFEGGRAVQIDADANADTLRQRCAFDAGASRLGEVALVDRDSRIGRLGRTFFMTLLDENAAVPPRARRRVLEPDRRPRRHRADQRERRAHRLHDRLGRRRRDRDHEATATPCPCSAAAPGRSRPERSRRAGRAPPARSRRASCAAPRRRTAFPRAGHRPFPNASAHSPLIVIGSPRRGASRRSSSRAALAEDVHMAVAEVPDEQAAAERPNERGASTTPHGAFRAPSRDARDEPPVAVELVDVAAGRRVVAVDRRALDVGHEHLVAERADAERRVPLRDRRVDERARPRDPPPARVEHVDAVVVEVGRVQPRRRRSRRRGRPRPRRRRRPPPSSSTSPSGPSATSRGSVPSSHA